MLDAVVAEQSAKLRVTGKSAYESSLIQKNAYIYIYIYIYILYIYIYTIISYPSFQTTLSCTDETPKVETGLSADSVYFAPFQTDTQVTVLLC